MPLIDGGTVRLPRLIGQSRAMDMICACTAHRASCLSCVLAHVPVAAVTGRAVPAAEALAWGLANRVVPRGHSRIAAEALAAELAQLCVFVLARSRRPWLTGLQATDLPALGSPVHTTASRVPALVWCALAQSGIHRVHSGACQRARRWLRSSVQAWLRYPRHDCARTASAATSLLPGLRRRASVCCRCGQTRQQRRQQCSQQQQWQQQRQYWCQPIVRAAALARCRAVTSLCLAQCARCGV